MFNNIIYYGLVKWDRREDDPHRIVVTEEVNGFFVWEDSPEVDTALLKWFSKSARDEAIEYAVESVMEHRFGEQMPTFERLKHAVEGLLKHFEGPQSMAAVSGLNYNCYAKELEYAKAVLSLIEEGPQP